MLGVSPHTLRGWERRYGFPRPQRSSGGHRHYTLEEIEALRQTLAETNNVSSAIELARERGPGPASSPRLSSAFAAFDEAAADRLLEESLALRSIERTVEEVLLPAVEAEYSAQTERAEYEFAWRHATGWISAMKRLSPPASRNDGILILDSSRRADLDALHAQALDLMLRRAGLRTLSLAPTIERTQLCRALRALEPRAVVLSGRSAPLETIGQIVYLVRTKVPGTEILDFRSAIPDSGASAVRRLGDRPAAAREAVLDLLERPRTSASGATSAVPAPAGAAAR